MEGGKEQENVVEIKELEMFQVGPCECAYQMGFLIGNRFSDTIRRRLEQDMVLRHHLLPFAQAPQTKPLIEAICNNNKAKYPSHWDELMGIVDGSQAPLLEVTSYIMQTSSIPLSFLIRVCYQCADHCTQLQEGDSVMYSG